MLSPRDHLLPKTINGVNADLKCTSKIEFLTVAFDQDWVNSSMWGCLLAYSGLSEEIAHTKSLAQPTMTLQWFFSVNFYYYTPRRNWYTRFSSRSPLDVIVVENTSYRHGKHYHYIEWLCFILVKCSRIRN